MSAARPARALSSVPTVVSSDLTRPVEDRHAAASSTADRERLSPVARFLVGLVRLYQATARFRAPRCRFLPTCSGYALESLTVHGAARGGWLALRRLGRCHPWHPGGFDPVPPRK